MKGVLHIIATPIGNLEDITLRALRILKEVDVVYCEDTRVTGKLLHHYEIDTKMQSLNARTEEQKINEVIDRMQSGENIAYVSDAGTPGISDPGVRLVSRAQQVGIGVVAIPGASALVSALSIAGLPTNTFRFIGFLPKKKGRKTIFETIQKSGETIVFYESPHRIIKALTSLAEVLDDTRTIAIARELTKLHEELQKGTPQEILEYYTQNPNKVRGEFVVMVN